MVESWSRVVEEENGGGMGVENRRIALERELHRETRD